MQATTARCAFATRHLFLKELALEVVFVKPGEYSVDAKRLQLLMRFILAPNVDIRATE